MKDGQELLLRGSAGAPFRVTVGQPFTQDEIEKRLKSGEWGQWGDQPAEPDANQETPAVQPAAEPTPATKVDLDRPAVNAPKSDWVTYVARTQHMSLADASNYTKADLIELGS